ncbi:MAG: ATP-binding cassette domain-containing protein [Proteobacteria bacterium]|nr:ATP-binding cassette domain-containing protein [Pseudomonadota bacterium]
MEITGLKDYAVLVESLTKKFGRVTAVDDLNLKVKRGEIFGLLGSDGAGKTTTLQMLCGILAPSSGLMFVGDYNVEVEPEGVRSVIGYMSQDFTLYLDMTVEENIDFMADLRDIPEADRQRQKERLLLFSRMEPFRHRRAAELSGGMKKKLALSCALIHLPSVLILDEPTTAVDPLSRTELWKILYEFIDQGITIIISTPYMDEAERCHRVALMQEGKVIACDTPANLKKQIKRKVCTIKTDMINRACRVLRDELSTPGQIYGDRIRLFLDTPEKDLAIIEAGLIARGIMVEDYSETTPTMDDVFVSLLQEQDKQRTKKDWVPFACPGESGGSSIAVFSLIKKFGNFTAVNDVSFEVTRGTVFGLLGPNGAGKTTVIKILCGLTPPTSGRAEVGGFDIATNPRQVKKSIGYMSQLFSLYPDLTVGQNLDFYGSVYGLGGKEKRKKKDWVVDFAGLLGKEKYLTSELAGGWKQKLALGCAIMHQPAVLFLDEPTSGVDPIARLEFWDIIYRLSEEGITTIVTTHFMDEAERCNIIGLMNGGNLVALGTPHQLKQDLAVDFYEIEAPPPVLESSRRLAELAFVRQTTLFGDKIHILTDKQDNELSIEHLLAAGIMVEKINRIQPSMEDVFIYHVLDDREQ